MRWWMKTKSGLPLYSVCHRWKRGLERRGCSPYTNSMKCNVQIKHEVPLPNVDHLYMSIEKEGEDDNKFRNAITVDMTEEGNRRSLWMYGRTS